jgi:glutaredoxin 3
MGSVSTKPMEIPESVKNLVDSLIQNKKVVVFSKSYCPYCTKAKKTFEKYSLNSEEYVVLEIESRDDCSHIQNYLKELTGASSVSLSNLIKLKSIKPF